LFIFSHRIYLQMAKKCGRYILTRVSLGLQVNAASGANALSSKYTFLVFMQPKHLSTEAITCAVKSHPAVRLQTEATLLVEKMGHFNF